MREGIRLPTGQSAAIRDVNALIRQVAQFDSTVLLLGDSGTGKEVAARAIHDLSPRRQRPFVAVNCGAIPADLLESELFGHEKGAFTGALTARKGRFEIAEGGTLFLDEIGDMSPTMQVKLLRVLQERVFERVGNHVPIRCNVRIIAATHRNLEQAIEQGTFREDLFHRLNVFPVEMPPLRARLEDLPLLVQEFIEQNVAEGRGPVELSSPAFTALMQYPWPGNVRELANLIERLSITCCGRTVTVADLPPRYRPPGWTPPQYCDEDPATRITLSSLFPLPPDAQAAEEEDEGPLPEQKQFRDTVHKPQLADMVVLPDEGIDLREHLLDIERKLVAQALERSSGVVAHAARLLSLRRTTLVEKLRKLGFENREFVTED